ncbi:MAG TPA: SH2 domain-containing protein [Rhabdochlamydiaceae bacterium]|nr:SH2 domain-containing protein [Rhabdochlamydiaceae bacterium]
MIQKQYLREAVEESHFDLNETLHKHGWRGQISIQEADKILAGQPAFSYLVRFGEEKSQFTLSFVHPDGSIRHECFRLVDWARGIFQNAAPYKAPLELLIPYKMRCTASEARAV